MFGRYRNSLLFPRLSWKNLAERNEVETKEKIYANISYSIPIIPYGDFENVHIFIVLMLCTAVCKFWIASSAAQPFFNNTYNHQIWILLKENQSQTRVRGSARVRLSLLVCCSLDRSIKRCSIKILFEYQWVLDSLNAVHYKSYLKISEFWIISSLIHSFRYFSVQYKVYSTVSVQLQYWHNSTRIGYHPEKQFKVLLRFS